MDLEDLWHLEDPNNEWSRKNCSACTPEYGCSACTPEYGCSACTPEYGCSACTPEYGCSLNSLVVQHYLQLVAARTK